MIQRSRMVIGRGVDNNETDGNKSGEIPPVIRLDDKVSDRTSVWVDNQTGHRAAAAVRATRLGPDCESCLCHARARYRSRRRSDSTTMDRGLTATWSPALRGAAADSPGAAGS